ncbi:MAG: hypothetical protein COA79_26370 [Planctomycetota bacterium]|nr:MAG: hypothetical protein COA79_26370 [Planctomycetota bacterium]
MRIILLLFLLMLFGCIKNSSSTTFPLKNIIPYKRLKNINYSKFNEPSGICHHISRKSLIVVGDEGDICEMDYNGKILQKKHLFNSDFEGVTHNPSTGLIYIAVEGEEKIIEINPAGLTVTREFILSRQLNGETLLKVGGQGIEAITFVPNSSHPHGGTFLVANQSLQLDSKDDISGIIEYEIPLNNKKVKKGFGKIIRVIQPYIIDLTGLYYEMSTKLIYVISESTNTLSCLSRAGILLNVQALPGQRQEGITFDSKGYLYIAQDSGQIIKYKPINQVN